MPAMSNRESWPLRAGFWATSLGTLASRVLGLVRDVATAALLGLGEGGVMDALVVAFRVANLPRRILGEGALATSFLPVFARQVEHDPVRAWQLLSAVFVWLTVALTGVCAVAQGLCAAAWWSGNFDFKTSQLAGLTAAMLPYAILICLAAQASAALQALANFRLPAMVPTLLNVCWLAAVWFVAPRFASDKWAQAYTIAAAIVLAGVLQLLVQLPALNKLGYHFRYDWTASREPFWQVARAMLPITLGMAVTQLNTLADSLIAWTLSAESSTSAIIPWLPGAVHYPMKSGAAAAIYYGERFYQLPLAMLGLAIATVIYPLLSRHAARQDRAAIGADLTLGLRLVWFTALPAGIGMILIAEPAVRLLFQRGQFTADDAVRASRMIASYATGVWAYSAIPVLVRGFYALDHRLAPARIGLTAVLINLALSLTLVWPLAERGLALATAISAGVQTVLLTAVFARRLVPLDWPALMTTLVRGAISCAAMTAAVLLVQTWHPQIAASSRTQLAIEVALAITVGAAVYLAMATLLRMPELRLLLGRSGSRSS
jgi:putative peptidoglycan lipid II flippase